MFLRAALRGGNWNNGSNARSGLILNLNNEPTNRNNNIGLRAALIIARRRMLKGILSEQMPKEFRSSLIAKYEKRRWRASSEPTFSAVSMEVYVKRANNIYEKVYSFENIYLAYIKARKNKRYREDVLEFTDNLEANLITIQNELIWKMYSPGRYREFVVCEPKRRIIQAPSFKDRVVQHALCNVIEPVFDLRFICDSYACRKGKGTHAGVERTIYFLRKLAGSSSRTYCLKADISSYFPSIDHTVLKTLLRKRVSCEATLWLIDTIIDSSSCGCTRGIPIGALTSQLFANIYLNELDTFVKHDLRAKHYVRYVDDFIILDHSKQRLREYLSEIKGYLEDRLRLALNHKTGIFPVSRGIDFLGYRIWADKLLLRRANIRRSKRRLRKLRVLYEDGAVKLEKLRSSVASWQGQCKFSKSYSAMQRVIDFAGLSEVFR